MRGIVRRAALVIAAFGLSLASPAVTQGTIPVDTETRAKFPKENGELLDALSGINSEINRLIKPMDDQEQYGVPDYWVMAPESLKGDCEDYVLTKLLMLSRAQFPAVSHSRVRGVLIYKNGKPVGGHAILELRLPKGGIMFLDNLHAKPMTRTELVARGYRFFDW